MKFNINAKVFKNITERVAIILNKKNMFPAFRTLVIETDNNMVKVFGTSDYLNSYVAVYTDDVDIIEAGIGYIDVQFLKRLYNITGEITVETFNGKLRISNFKKQSEVYTEPFDYTYMSDNQKKELLFKADKDDFLDTICKLTCCLSTNEQKPLFTGYNIVKKDEDISVVSCDAYKLMRRVTNWNGEREFNITIPNITKFFKKISDNKEEENISAYTDDKYIWIEGKDFTYIVNLLEGNYPDLTNNLYDENYDYWFDVDAKELMNIGKEYSDITKEDCNGKMRPMYMCFTKNGFNTAVITSNYITSDNVDVYGNESNHLFYNTPKEMIWAVNPRYIKDVMKVFGDNIITVHGGNNKIKPWKFVDDNGYCAMILPVRDNETFVNAVKDFIESKGE